jgi:hypothetical protein
LSHDQRPGRIRVVGDASAQPKQRRRGEVMTIDGVAETVANATASNSSAAAPAGLPLVPALLFLLACIGGGIAVALLTPFGNG